MGDVEILDEDRDAVQTKQQLVDRLPKQFRSLKFGIQ